MFSRNSSTPNLRRRWLTSCVTPQIFAPPHSRQIFLPPNSVGGLRAIHTCRRAECLRRIPRTPFSSQERRAPRHPTEEGLLRAAMSVLDRCFITAPLSPLYDVPRFARFPIKNDGPRAHFCCHRRPFFSLRGLFIAVFLPSVLRGFRSQPDRRSPSALLPGISIRAVYSS